MEELLEAEEMADAVPGPDIKLEDTPMGGELPLTATNQSQVDTLFSATSHSHVDTLFSAADRTHALSLIQGFLSLALYRSAVSL